MTDPYPLEELARLPTFYHPTAAPDGDRLAFYWDTTGRNELYVMTPDGEPVQVSDGEVPRTPRWGIAWDAAGERILYHRDEAGDEQNDIHALTPDGDHEVLVDLEGQCNIADASDPDHLYFTATVSGQLNAHRRSAATGETEQLTDHDQPVQGLTVSPDGTRIAYTTNETDDLDNRDIYVAAADGSDPRRLPVGESGYEATVADWLPDGSGLLVGDETTDMNRVGVHDLADETTRWYSPGEYEERPVAALEDGRLLAVRLREAGVVPLVYEDGVGRELALPEGVASFSGGPAGVALADGELLVSHQTPHRRTELVRYDLATDEYATVLAADYGSIDPEAFVDAEYVTYESTDGLEIGGLCYRPPDASADDPVPAVVEVHGGPTAQSMRSFSPFTQYLVSRGHAVFQPNYRGSIGRGREFKDAIKGDWGGMEQADVVAGGRWLKERPWIDADRVAVYGGSYGGYSVYCQLTTYPADWTAGVARVGITDLLRLHEEDMPHFQTYLEQQMGDPDENEALWRERSPITHVDAFEGPLLVLHGRNDPRCPVSQARVFRDALEERGLEEGEDGAFEYHEFDEGHGSADIEEKIRSFRLMADFLERRL